MNIHNSNAAPVGGIFGFFGGGKKTSRVQLGTTNDITTLVAYKSLDKAAGEAQFQTQSSQKSLGFFQRHVTVKNGDGYLDINIASCAKRLGISKQEVFEFAKQDQSQLFANLEKINQGAPNFSAADYIKTSFYLEKNKGSIIEKMQTENKETTYIRPTKENGLPRAIQINRDGQVIIHFNKKKKGDRVLGEGSFKTVKFAWDLNKNQLIAVGKSRRIKNHTFDEIKELSEQEVAFSNAFKGDPQVAQLTQLVEVEGKGKEKKLLFLQPIYSEGSLSTFLKKNDAIDIETKKALALQMVTACSRLEEKGVIHKDIKPDNFLVKKNDQNPPSYEVALADFGCAEWSTKKTGQAIGTLLFLSPEYFGVITNNTKLKDSDEIKNVTTNKHDAWALGITLFEMFTGKLPIWCFSRAYKWSLNLQQKTVDDECGTVPEPFRFLVAALLKVNPNQRRSAKEAIILYGKLLAPNLPNP